MPVNYSNGKLYKIWSPSHPEDIYIGSTTQPLAKRMVGHRTSYKRFQEGKTNYTTSFKILEYGDAKIELIENFECKCKEQLTAREGFYIRKLDCVNKVIAGRTIKEWRQDNKDKIKQYLQENKDKITQQQKQYRQENKDKMKQYYQDNKEKIKQYRQDNQDKIKQRVSEKIPCDCGSVVRRDYLARHKKSNKHMKYLEEKKLE